MMDVHESQTENILQSNSVKEAAKNLAHLIIIYLLAIVFYNSLVETVIIVIDPTAKSVFWSGLSIFLISNNIVQLLTLPIFLSFYKEYKPSIMVIPRIKLNFSGTIFIKIFIFKMAINFTLSLFASILQSATGYNFLISLDIEKTLFNTILLLFTMAVIPALVEEFMFRFVIYRYLRKYGVVFAAVTSSVLFGLIHMNLFQFIYTIFGGIALCYVYEASGKFRYPVLLHFLNNAFAVLTDAAPLSEHIYQRVELTLGIVSLIGLILFYIKSKSVIKEKIIEIKPELTQVKDFFKTRPILIFSLFCLAIPLFEILRFIVK